MTKEDIIRMAREAQSVYATETWTFSLSANQLERFAALVAAHERNRLWTQNHWTEYERSITSAEREMCAQIAENGLIGHTIAKAIRARGEK
jgi:hypothetical protein